MDKKAKMINSTTMARNTQEELQKIFEEARKEKGITHESTTKSTNVRLRDNN